MSAPIRFLGLAILAYAGLRTASSALALEPVMPVPLPLPGEAAAPVMAEAVEDPQAPAPQDPAAAAAAAAAMPYGYGPGYGPYAAMPAGQMMPPGYFPYPVIPAAMMAPPPRQRYVEVPVYPASYPAPYRDSYPAPYPAPPPSLPPASADQQPLAATSSAFGGGEAPPLEAWPAIGTSGPFSVGSLQETPSWGRRKGRDGPIAAAGQSRWSADVWGLLRPPRPGLLPLDDPDGGINPGLASGGALGGSQAGLRISWRPMPRMGVHVRASTALIPQARGGQTMAGGEASLGVSYQPLGGLPVRLLAERRQRLGPAFGGGRDAFAFMAEGGVSDRELVHGIRLDGYGQAGMVGARSRSWFADGALTATYPFMPRFAVGGGM